MWFGKCAPIPWRFRVLSKVVHTLYQVESSLVLFMCSFDPECFIHAFTRFFFSMCSPSLGSKVSICVFGLSTVSFLDFYPSVIPVHIYRCVSYPIISVLPSVAFSCLSIDTYRTMLRYTRLIIVDGAGGWEGGQLDEPPAWGHVHRAISSNTDTCARRPC